MPVFGPITTDRKVRRFGVYDLEWVPGEVLPQPECVEVVVEGLRERCRLPLPPGKVTTSPLQLRLAGYYDQQVAGGGEEGEEVERVERYQCFLTVRELLAFLLTREFRGTWFLAHAGGLADVQFVFDELLRQIKEEGPRVSKTTYGAGGKKEAEHSAGPWRIRASFSGSSAIIVHVTRGKNSWHFVDSYWLLRDKLASIGKAIGVRKGDSPEALAWMSRRFGREVTDFEQLTREEKTVFYRELPHDILVAYNKTDCEILWRAVAQFEREVLGLGGQLQQTIASTAMTLFRRSYLQREIYTSEKLNQVAQEAYFASRVEVFSRHAENFYAYDVNSSFPYAMTFPLPGNLTEFRTDLPPGDGDEVLYLADVTLEVPDVHLPPVPIRRDGRVFFPVGRWRSWLTSTDVRLALREGATLHKVHEVYCFEPFYDFRGYAEDIYHLRSSTDVPFRKLLLKYLLNSLYGKAAEGTLKQEMLINPAEVDRAACQMLQPGVWLRDKEAVVAHRHVVVSAFITAIARRTLFDYCKSCYAQNCKPYYTDTDSIFTKAELPVDEKKLGALKLEKKMEWAEFTAPKIYQGEGFELNRDGTWSPKKVNKAKGFSLGSGQEAFERLAKIVGGDRVGIQRMTRLRELYRTQVGGQYVTAPFEVMVVKALTFDALCKRFHYPDGETRPWSIAELKSGDYYPRGFDFDAETWALAGPEVRSLVEEVVGED